MEEVVHTIARWACGSLAVAAILWGAIVLTTGRAPQRELRRFRSARDYGRFSIGSGVAFGLVAVGTLGGWFGLGSLAGFGLLLWLNTRIRRRR
jgi:hypothetical protein